MVGSGERKLDEVFKMYRLPVTSAYWDVMYSMVTGALDCILASS